MSLPLPNGCHIGKLSVHPKDWLEATSITGDWYIHYRFHDPNFAQKHPKGKLVAVQGMNQAKTAAERRRITRGLIKNEEDRLQAGYNPILRRYVEISDLEISPQAPFSIALDMAYKLLPKSKAKNEVRKALKHIKAAIIQLRYDGIPIEKVRRKNVLAVLTKISRTKEEASGKEWGAPSYNHYRSYFIMLFKQLALCEAAEVNLELIPIKKGIKRKRAIPSDQQMEVIDQEIRAKYYTFWRFIHIFHHSGARMAELMQVRFQDVDLAASRFSVIVRKRNGDAEEEDKTIMRRVASLWQEVVSEAKPGEYLFARGLRPGPVAISERQVTIRWREHVKKKLGILADFYSLKKKNTTEIVSKELEKIRQAQLKAAEVNSQKGTAMVEKHYDDQAAERLHNQLRAI